MSLLAFSFNPSLIPESQRIDFVTKFFSLSMEYQALTGFVSAVPMAAAAAVSYSPPAETIPHPSEFHSFSEDERDGEASQVSEPKKQRKNGWLSMTEEQRAARLAKMSESRINRKLRKMSEDSLASEKPVSEMNHKELCKKYRDLKGRKHNPKYPYGGVPKAFSGVEALRGEILRLLESETHAAPAASSSSVATEEVHETSSETSSKKPRKSFLAGLTQEEREERRARLAAARIERKLAAMSSSA